MSTTKEEEEELCCQVFAQLLGIESDEPFYEELYPLAKKLLYVLPQGWEVIIGQADLDGIPIFFNKNENISQWNHPLEADHIETVQAKRQKLMLTSPATSRPGSRPVSAQAPEPLSGVAESPSVQNSSFLSEIEIIFAQILGIETGEENAFQLIFLAKELLYALPEGWEVISGQSDMGIIPYFFDSVNQVSYWTHPYEAQCIQIIENKRVELYNAKHGTNLTSINKKLFNITETDEQSVEEQQILNNSAVVEEVNMMELTELDVLFANLLGVDVDNEKYAMQLCYLAKELLFELPPGWEVSVSTSELGVIPIFVDTKTDSSHWTHPLEAAHKQRIIEARALLESQSTPQESGREGVEAMEVQEYNETEESDTAAAAVEGGGSTANLNEPSAVSTILQLEDSEVVGDEEVAESFKEVYNNMPAETVSAPHAATTEAKVEAAAPPTPEKADVTAEVVESSLKQTEEQPPAVVETTATSEEVVEEEDPFVAQVEQNLVHAKKQLGLTVADHEGEQEHDDSTYTGQLPPEGLSVSPKHVIDREHIVDYLGGGSFSGVVEESDKQPAFDVTTLLEQQQRAQAQQQQQEQREGAEEEEAARQREELERLQQLVQEQQELERRLAEEAASLAAAAAAAAAAEEEARRVQAIQQAKEAAEAERAKKRDQKVADEEQRRLRMLSDLKTDKALNLVMPLLLEQCFAECAGAVVKEIVQRAEVEALAEEVSSRLYPLTVEATLQAAVNEAAVLERFLVLHQIQAAELLAKSRQLFPHIDDEIAASPFKFADEGDSLVDIDSFVTKLTIDTGKKSAFPLPGTAAQKGTTKAGGRASVVAPAPPRGSESPSHSLSSGGGGGKPKLSPQRSDSKLSTDSPKHAKATIVGGSSSSPVSAASSKPSTTFAPVSPTPSITKTYTATAVASMDIDNASATSALTNNSGSLHSGSHHTPQPHAHASPSESALFNKRVIRVKTDYLKMLRSNKVVDSKLSHNVAGSPDKSEGGHDNEDVANEVIQEHLHHTKSPKKKHHNAAATTPAAPIEGQYQRLNQLEPICGGPPVNPNQIKWYLLGSYDIHKEAVKSRQVIVHIVNMDSLGTILIDPKDNFIDSVLEQEVAENREKEKQIKTLMRDASKEGTTAQLESLLGNSRPSSPDVEVSKRPMEPNLIIGRMKSTSEKLSKIRIRRDLARQQWVIETDDNAIRKIINRHKKKGKVENSLLESSATTFTLKPKETKIIDVTSIDQIGMVKTFGSLHKLPATLLSQTLPQKVMREESGPQSASSPVEDSAFFEPGKKRRAGKRGSGGGGGGTAVGNSSSSNNNNNIHDDDDNADVPDFASSHSLSKTMPANLRQSSAEGPLKLPSIGASRNVSSS